MTADKTLYIVRHGETEWSLSGRHTGLTDLDLTENGVIQAQKLARRIAALPIDHIFTSPLMRAYKTCTLCGLSARAVRSPALVEWDYGDYEGKTSGEIHQIDPHWNLFQHGAKNGESLEDVENRVDTFLASLPHSGSIMLFTSGHIGRAIAARWLKLPVSGGRLFVLSTASLSKLGFEHSEPVIQLWNDTSHL